tara:strand:- start:4471 stop:4737 length:267 start_codon:yes stop_codon:yes gene_type:complete
VHGLSKDSAATANAPGGRGFRRESGPVRLIEDERIALAEEIPCGESEKGATVSKEALFQTRILTHYEKIVIHGQRFYFVRDRCFALGP